jgi:hypothetical protein
MPHGAGRSDCIRDLVRNPPEALGVEIKTWIDPGSVEGEAKIARAALAIRNLQRRVPRDWLQQRNNAAGSHQSTRDVRIAFRADVGRGIVSRCASGSFEVAVHFRDRMLIWSRRLPPRSANISEGCHVLITDEIRRSGKNCSDFQFGLTAVSY